jgi:trk system potassium uptake protein
MRLKTVSLRLNDYLKKFRKHGLWIVNKFLFLLSFLMTLVIIYDAGFVLHDRVEAIIRESYVFACKVFVSGFTLRLLLHLGTRKSRQRIIAELIIVVFLFLVLSTHQVFENAISHSRLFNSLLGQDFVLQTLVLIVFVIELSMSQLNLDKHNLNPALLFAGSFLLLVLVGAGLLLLPRSTVHGISITDAVFTSTSAVCVTGLIVIDTATEFTLLGKTIILGLIQVGGLGIMTFTSFFGFFFRGSSFRDEMLIKDFVNEEKMGEIFRTIAKIISITFLVEAIGALFIYLSLPNDAIPGVESKLYFSVFHSISAFCNAGFSTLSNGLYEIPLRGFYGLQWVIAFLIIAGGLGFPIVLNYYTLAKVRVKRGFYKLVTGNSPARLGHVISVNTRIVVITTTLLLVFGTIIIYFSGSDAIRGLDWFGKITASFFTAATARTAGFNTIDMGGLSRGGILLMMVLMWIGASPGSTGGGIKTTTFAVSIINIRSMILGKDRMELYRREIPAESVKRAYAIITLSLLYILLAVSLLAFFEPGIELMPLVFEVVSAFSTVGLSLGVTPELSLPGRYLIIITMFVGRVGLFTLLVAFVKRVRSLQYRYPAEHIFIN